MKTTQYAPTDSMFRFQTMYTSTHKYRLYLLFAFRVIFNTMRLPTCLQQPPHSPCRVGYTRRHARLGRTAKQLLIFISQCSGTRSTIRWLTAPLRSVSCGIHLVPTKNPIFWATQPCMRKAASS